MSWKTLKKFFEAFICETVLITDKQLSFLQAFDMIAALFILQPMQKTTMPKEKKINIKDC